MIRVLVCVALLSVIAPVEQSGRRIFNAHRTRIKFFPFVASIQIFQKFQCAGSIVRRDLVITAASCLQLAYNNRFFRENPAFLSVQVGSDYYEAGGEYIPVIDVFFHPDYDPSNLNNNIAVLRLDTDIVFDKKINNVKRIWFDRNPAPIASNVDGITILGWGARDHSNIVYGPWRNRLSYAELEFYPLKDCQEIYSKEYVTYKNFCAGYFTKGTGACNHDVGGPGISSGKLYGVISFGPPVCGTPDAPTVFTKVGYYRDWIESIMKQKVQRIVRLSTKRRPRATFALQYSDATRVSFTVKPIRTGKSSYEEIPIPTGAESLRIIKDNEMFKDFMSTMFESKDVAEDLATFGEEKCKECDKDKKTTMKVKTKTSSLVKHTTHLIKSLVNEAESDESRADEIVKIQNKMESKLKTSNKKHKSAGFAEDDLKLDADITNLLDDLDLYKLLNSEEPLSNSETQEDLAVRAKEVNESMKINIGNKNVIKSTVENIYPTDNAKHSSYKKKSKDIELMNKKPASDKIKDVKKHNKSKKLTTHNDLYDTDKNEQNKNSFDQNLSDINDNYFENQIPKKTSDVASMNASNQDQDISQDNETVNSSIDYSSYSSDEDKNVSKEKNITGTKVDKITLNRANDENIKKKARTSIAITTLNPSDGYEDMSENIQSNNTSVSNLSYLSEEQENVSKKSNAKKETKKDTLNLSVNENDGNENMTDTNESEHYVSIQIHEKENVIEKSGRINKTKATIKLSSYEQEASQIMEDTNISHTNLSYQSDEDADVSDKARVKPVNTTPNLHNYEDASNEDEKSAEKDADYSDSSQANKDQEDSNEDDSGLSIETN